MPEQNICTHHVDEKLKTSISNEYTKLEKVYWGVSQYNRIRIILRRDCI